ncbi:ACP S-malonyltransferase [Aliiglaciecola sp. M165]|uniref:ACP S-malonyltransferase n=1 Tax=Aliiglaciecola sp. M165 TaxID=2593649 RepID=UPI00117FA251|nr:ACP S-malonyltransferase [Aliiglaciecola sp. M165]TRY32347.1 ACP S-malonyltransferase [Aliiglaciecola sp. M165]
MSKTAFVFPGQGSQSVGMLADLAEQYPQIQQTFSEASDALGYDLWELVQSDPENRLNQTQFTQPALLTASVAIYRLLISLGATRPEFMAGHSLGEYSALVCSGVLTLTDAVKLVQARGQFMQEAVPEGEGAMYAIIGLNDAAILEACAKAQESTAQVVAAVNFNSPGQVVIAGSKEAAESAALLCKEAGAKRALPLSVSVPSHCDLMKPAAEKLASMLENVDFATPECSVVNNVDVEVKTDSVDIKDALTRQLYRPVRWTQTVEFLRDNGVEHIAEIGPGKVLSGLVKRIDKTLSSESVNTPDSVSNSVN